MRDDKIQFNGKKTNENTKKKNTNIKTSGKPIV